MNDFQRDNNWQRSVRDTILAPGFYGKYSTDGRYVFVDKGRLAQTLQRRWAVDTILQGRDGRAICIEEKIVRWKGYFYRDFCLETHSCTKAGYESDGWMRYGKADYLLYCFQQSNNALRCHLIDFQQLKNWFWPISEKFPTFGPLKTLNATMGRKVPIGDVYKNVPAWGRWVGRPLAASE